MPQLNIEIKDTQIISLVEQLPKKKRRLLLKRLIVEDMQGIEKISNIGEKKFLAFCQKRGVNPRLLSEEEKEKLIDNILHENS